MKNNLLIRPIYLKFFAGPSEGGKKSHRACLGGKAVPYQRKKGLDVDFANGEEPQGHHTTRIPQKKSCVRLLQVKKT